MTAKRSGPPTPLFAVYLVVPACAAKVADTEVAPDAEQLLHTPETLTLGCSGMMWLSIQDNCFQCNGFGGGACKNCINSSSCSLQPVGFGGPGCPSASSNIDVACRCGTIRLVSDVGPSPGNGRQQRYTCE